MPETGRHTAVVIVGGGPVGMALAIDLALRNVTSIVVEMRADGAFLSAKTNMTNIRSMEHFRRWGIADALRANDIVGPEVQRDVSIITRLNGHLVHHFPKTYEATEALAFAAELGEWAPNECIEKTLYDRANTLPAITRLYGHEATRFTQDEDGVSVECTGPDGAVEVRGQYLVVANGARSRLRSEGLNVRMEGKADLAVCCSWNFRAPDLHKLWKAGPIVSMAYFYNEDRGADLLMPQEGVDRFLYYSAPVPAGVDGNDWEQIKAMLFRAVGQEFAVEPISGGEFGVHSLLAPRLDFGRILLAGDAAHLVSPQGGFGMNLGIGDAAGLGWKLQALIEGWGGKMLLPAYSIERRETVQFIQRGTEQNQAMGAPQLVRDGIEIDGPEGDAVRAAVSADIVEFKTQQFKSMGGQLGYRYSLSPIIVRDGTPYPPEDFRTFVENASPGHRAPHRFLADGSALYDHVGPGFTLLDLDGIDTAEWESAATDLGMPLKVFRPGQQDREMLRPLYGAGAALIRSDHHIAWRGDATPDNVAQVLRVVTGNQVG